MKVLIFDAGPIINFSLNGLIELFKDLRLSFEGKFLITEAVKKEVIDHPIKIPRFELNALRVQNLIEEKILELPNSLNISNDLIKTETQRIMNIANRCIYSRNTWINIISEGEASCLALSNELNKRYFQNIIAIDERTTRILSEKPENLQKIFMEKLHANVRVDNSNLEEFSKFRFIRSTELIYVAYKKGLFKLKGKNVLEAALYATKFKGSSVSFEEIEELKKL